MKHGAKKLFPYSLHLYSLDFKSKKNSANIEKANYKHFTLRVVGIVSQNKFKKRIQSTNYYSLLGFKDLATFAWFRRPG